MTSTSGSDVIYVPAERGVWLGAVTQCLEHISVLGYRKWRILILKRSDVPAIITMYLYVPPTDVIRLNRSVPAMKATDL